MSAGKRIGFRIGLVGALLAVAPVLWAADENKVLFPGGGAPSAAPAHETGTANLLTLAVAVVLAAAGGWVVWRRRHGQGAAHEAHALAIRETRSLGNRQYLVVAAYEGRKFLLGVCPGRIDLLAPLNERHTPDQTSS